MHNFSPCRIFEEKVVYMKKLSTLLKVSAVLWIIWGLVHIFAGIMTVKGVLTDDISASVSGIADKVDPTTLQMDYPKAAGAIIGQHGFNLLWIGLVTFLAAFYIWKGNNACYLYCRHHRGSC